MFGFFTNLQLALLIFPFIKKIIPFVHFKENLVNAKPLTPQGNSHQQISIGMEDIIAVVTQCKQLQC